MTADAKQLADRYPGIDGSTHTSQMPRHTNDLCAESMNSSANGHQDDDGHAVDSELDFDLDDDDGPKVPLMEQAAGLLRHIWFEFK